MTTNIPSRPRLSAHDLARHAQRHSFDVDSLGIDAIDATRPFVCETITPLYYCPSYTSLPEPARVRYAQIMGLFTNEIITFFESHFAHAVLSALSRDGFRPLPAEMVRELTRFIDEERKHVHLWTRLNQLAAPQWYADRPYHLLRIPPGVRTALRLLTSRPTAFPVVLWLMLLQEERSIDISRRCIRARREVEPHFLAAYQAHLEEEVRHVQIDWHLIERYYTDRRPAVRRSTAILLRTFLDHFLLTPRRSTVRAIDLLLAEFPDIRPLRETLVSEIRQLGGNDDFQRMMYSRETTPIAFSLFDRFPEFRPLSSVLRAYHPAAAEVA